MMLAYCFFGCSLIFMAVAILMYLDGDHRSIPWIVGGILVFLIYGGFTYTIAEEHQAQLKCTTQQQTVHEKIEDK